MMSTLTPPPPEQENPRCTHGEQQCYACLHADLQVAILERDSARRLVVQLASELKTLRGE